MKFKKSIFYFNDILIPSIQKALTIEPSTGNKQSQLLNNFRIIVSYSLFVYVINSIPNYFSGFTYSFFVTSICSCIIILFINIISIKNFVFLRFLFILIMCTSLCLLCYIEGIVSGNYLFLFVFIIIAAFIYDFKETNQLIAALTLIIVSLGFVFLFTPFRSVLQPLNESSERSYFVFNIFSASIITCLLSFILLRQNFTSSKAIINKQQFLDAVYNTSFDAVFVLNIRDFTIDNCNTQSFSIFDAPDESSILKKPFHIFFKSYAGFEDFNDAVKNEKQIWKGELTCCTITGAEFPAYVSVVPFMNGDEVLKKINILDITDIKKVQAELTIAKDKAEQAMNAKSKFLSNMSHELRTPLNGIIGTANLLLDGESMPEQEEHFSLLKYSSEHMLNLVNDVLDFSKIEAGMMELERTSFNLKDFFTKIQSLFISQFASKNVTLQMIIDEKLNSFFWGDETKLSQVLSNLISNALKFTDKGDVIVTAKMIQKNSKSASIFFSVKDSGIGITEQQQKTIFYSFTQGDTTTTRKFGGTGLGLAISKSIIELYKGKLEVNSKKEEGSEFYFTIQLDLQLDNKHFVNERVLGTLSNFTDLKILVVEDNKINMLIARKFLQKWGIEVTEAVNGLEAMSKFPKKNFDLLLVDLEMPEMDGYETIAAIRKINESIPVIAFTAAVYDNIHQDLLNHGFSDYIQKPFRPEDLHRKITQYSQASLNRS